jgi:site-specific DNA-methyltransferase (adenine-specific)
MAGPLSLTNKEFTYSSFRLDTIHLAPIGTPTFNEWVTVGRFLKDAEQSVQFWIGDWLLYGEKTFGKTLYEQAIRETGLEYGTLRDYKWVAQAVPVEQRTDKLGFHHHREVASLPQETQQTLLSQAITEHWSLDKLKQEKFRIRATPLPAPSRLVHPGFLFGDCLPHLAALPDASLDLLLTDPPYGLDYESDHREVNPLPKIANDRLEDTVTVIDQALALASRKLKQDSHVYLFTSWKTYPILLPIIARYFQVHNLLMWVKNNWTAGDLDANYGQIHECIVFAQKGNRVLHGPPASDLLRFSRVSENGRVHPTEKPLPLLEYLIEKSSRPGEVVCDPFAGVASTLLAAKRKGRQFIGMEIDETWYKHGLARL